MLKITLDTNTIRPERISTATRKVRGGVEVITTTTVVREIGSVYDPLLSELTVEPEVFVLGASRLAGDEPRLSSAAALASAADAVLFEHILDVISSRHRSTLTEGERNQMRDAMIFCTHVREAETSS